ncbi:hypothetical protein BD626DRAFT_496874 [Schizophyllum amplum]|uniref:Copper-fist domain-containing protein n=1 Tax=Schizophyllum amplum TaxID=97359 RepID=A0A550CDJ0_9AGAR|nr:hypothetical protein BD626DRAFT_496874 [Auriculariopsis ampla]
MPFVNNKKFACESCIKGHRSSNCHHTDRPLFEVKKKGRPVSQCTKCRELRKTRKLHSKCSCPPTDEPEARTLLAPASASGKPRYMPIAPALPNGLRDVLQGNWAVGALAADARQRVDALLNPCSCKDARRCKCKGNASSTSAVASTSTVASKSSSALMPASSSSAPILAFRSTTATSGPNTLAASSGLNALAAAAAAISRHTPSHAKHPSSVTSKDSTNLPPKHPSSRPPSPKHKRSKVAPAGSCCASTSSKTPTTTYPSSPTPNLSLSPGPTLPPLLLDSADLNAFNLPTAFDLPHFTTFTSLAGSGCTCGVDCVCPGCSQHRGAEHVTHTHEDCADGNCPHCVTEGGEGDRLFAASGLGGFGGGYGGGNDADENNDPLARFFARAALLPLPPVRAGERVELPKLECCGGNCGCPNGTCGCGQACNGCCEMHAGEKGHDCHGRKGHDRQTEAHGRLAGQEVEEEAGRERSVARLIAPPPAQAPRSCCAGKNAS